MTLAIQSNPTAPEIGQLAVVRRRYWVVTDVIRSGLAPDVFAAGDERPQHLVELTSVEDDAHGANLRVIWELEPGAQILAKATLPEPRVAHFDAPGRLDAFIDAVRWGAISSADSKALQAPYRAGITIEEYQLDPVVRALKMPRVNLLIADDVGLGKTIEAGLVIQELLLRHRARTVLIVCPATLCLKWQAEMTEKFGLEFQIVDAEYVRDLRRKRGVGANVWKSFPRLIVSLDWLKRPRPMSLFREVLPVTPTYPREFDLLVIDEAHSIAPAGRGHYAVDSQRTQAIREIASHFEHRLFLSATPHNGYAESYTALLELLDPQRFARGIQPSEEAKAQAVVRRLKSELRQTLPPNPDGTPRFAERIVRPIEVDYPAEERAAHQALQRYAASRASESVSKAAKTASNFVTLLLKKRLFSSPAAFAATLDVHLSTLAKAARARSSTGEEQRRLRSLIAASDRIEEEGEEDEAQTAVEDALGAVAQLTAPLSAEQEHLLRELRSFANNARMRADAKAEQLLTWLDGVCRPVGPDGVRVWNNERVIIFTEYRDTQTWLQAIMSAHGLGGDRLSLMHGGMDDEDRERIKAEFQFDPAQCPVRILLATDSASEGIDLQRHCHRLVHFEIPFNPNRLEQRNGRIDRHGQRASHVLIHHFVGKGFEDAEVGSYEGDLEFLSRVATRVTAIREDLGSAGPVLAQQVEEAMLGTRRAIDERPLEERRKLSRAVLRMERDLREQIVSLREQLEESTKELQISPDAIARLVQVGLELGRQEPLTPTTIVDPNDATRRIPAFKVPALTDAWAGTIADLDHPVTHVRRPITFDNAVASGRDDVVLVHLGHRLVMQAMRLLRAEIWSEASEGKLRHGTEGLSRVTARYAPATVVSGPAVVAHARLVITGGDGHRLHEEVITAGGFIRNGRFVRFDSLKEQSAVLAATTPDLPSATECEALVGHWPAVSHALFRALEARGADRAGSLQKHLTDRADADASAITSVMTELRTHIEAQLDTVQNNPQLTLFEPDERQQLSQDVDALRRRLAEIPAEIIREVQAVQDRYRDPQNRLFPAAVTFVVPVPNSHASVGRVAS